MEKDFIIDQVSWHTQRLRNYEFDKSIAYLCFKNFINYLQEHNLTTHIILAENREVNDETCIKRSDLTDNGFELVKKVYDKWSDKVIDKKILPLDCKLLDKALKIICGK